MEQRGRGGQRSADLCVRKLTDYAPKWALLSPYVLLSLGYLAGSFFSLGSTVEESLHADLGNMKLIFLLLPSITIFAMTILMHTVIVKKPIDWRSDAPASFAEKVHSSIRRMVRRLIVVQAIYVISVVANYLASLDLMLGKGLSNSIHIVILSKVVFLVVSVGCFYANQRTLMRLEEERWTATT